MIKQTAWDRLMEESERAHNFERAATETQTSIEVHVLNGQVVIKFGEAVSSVGLSPALARSIADGLRQGANQLDQPRKRHKGVRA